MFSLEYKQLHIVREPLRKNCCAQSYRWKQRAICSEREPLQKVIDAAKDKSQWRIVELPWEGNNGAKGGIILNNDNDEARRMMEFCYSANMRERRCEDG